MPGHDLVVSVKKWDPKMDPKNFIILLVKHPRGYPQLCETPRVLHFAHFESASLDLEALEFSVAVACVTSESCFLGKVSGVMLFVICVAAFFT